MEVIVDFFSVIIVLGVFAFIGCMTMLAGHLDNCFNVRNRVVESHCFNQEFNSPISEVEAILLQMNCTLIARGKKYVKFLCDEKYPPAHIAGMIALLALAFEVKKRDNCDLHKEVENTTRIMTIECENGKITSTELQNFIDTLSSLTTHQLERYENTIRFLSGSPFPNKRLAYFDE